MRLWGRCTHPLLLLLIRMGLQGLASGTLMSMWCLSTPSTHRTCSLWLTSFLSPASSPRGRGIYLIIMRRTHMTPSSLSPRSSARIIPCLCPLPLRGQRPGISFQLRPPTSLRGRFVLLNTCF
jgi:hypothetical protein